FTVANGRVLFGLSAIKGCGGQAAEAIAAERARGGPFRDLDDFCGRLDPSVVNKTAVESLAKAGALDGLGGHRGAILAGIEKAMAAGAARVADRKSGQKNLFDAFEDAASAAASPVPSSLPDVSPLSDLEMRSGEKEVLGYYVHSHPLAEHASLLEAICTHGTGGLGAVKAKGDVVIGGLVAALKLSNVKQPRPGSTHTRYGMFDLEDMDGLVRTICWPEDYARLGEWIVADAVVVVSGSIDRRAGSDETNLIVNDLVPIADVWSRPVRSVTVKVTEPGHGPETLDRLAQVLRRHPGQAPVRLVLELADGRRVLMEADREKVAWSHALLVELTDLLGLGCVRAAVTLGQKRRDAEPARRGPKAFA
ncbi:MAG: OB-fold nucleic acid binding domain-containing protein, partial [Planctomycetia bacterium]